MIFGFLFLFIAQLIGFYFIVLLYMKVAKLKELENKQKKLMNEMDNSIGAYLSELKDENDRLIEALAVREEKPHKASPQSSETEKPPIQEGKEQEITLPKMPVHLALKSYKVATAKGNESTEKKEGKEAVHILDNEELDDRERVLQLHDRGHSIETIAKKLNKGKTEVELLLKFR